MSIINGIIIVLSISLVVLFIRYMLLKMQIKNLSQQMDYLLNGDTEKMLDISLIDHDLEQLAATLNQYCAKQRYTVAGVIQHEEHLKESISNISHDLRTPLTVIAGHLQLLNKSEIPAEQRKRVEIALHKAERMKDLIGTFYELSLLDTKQMKPQMERINFSNLLIDFLTENAPLLEEKKIQPEITLPENSVFIEADKNMIERILQNLLSNAVRYSTGKISIVLQTDKEEKAILNISNTIPNELSFSVDRIFERFYTGDKSRHSESTGLGLAVVKLLTEKMGGKIFAKIQNDRLSIEIRI